MIERILLYSGISILFGTILGVFVAMWFSHLFIHMFLIGATGMFLMLCIGCMGDYTVRLVDKGEEEKR